MCGCTLRGCGRGMAKSLLCKVLCRIYKHWMGASKAVPRTASPTAMANLHLLDALPDMVQLTVFEVP
jgi:hypothetical protein